MYTIFGSIIWFFVHDFSTSCEIYPLEDYFRPNSYPNNMQTGTSIFISWGHNKITDLSLICSISLYDITIWIWILFQEFTNHVQSYGVYYTEAWLASERCISLNSLWIVYIAWPTIIVNHVIIVPRSLGRAFQYFSYKENDHKNEEMTMKTILKFNIGNGISKNWAKLIKTCALNI